MKSLYKHVDFPIEFIWTDAHVGRVEMFLNGDFNECLCAAKLEAAHALSADRLPYRSFASLRPTTGTIERRLSRVRTCFLCLKLIVISRGLLMKKRQADLMRCVSCWVQNWISTPRLITTLAMFCR